jgi:hypothetical protein
MPARRAARTILVSVMTLCSLLLVSCDHSEAEELAADNAELRTRVDELETALREANGQISQAATTISEAKDYAYGDCMTLRQIVEGMDEPEEVREP